MRTVVGIIRGGPSSEYEVSLKTGASVLEELDREKYDARDIFIDRQGYWHLHGVPVSPDRALRGVDVVFNAMHGHFGEDGTVQRLLDSHGIPYTGSRAFPSAIAFNKQLTKEAVQRFNIKTPAGIVLPATQSPDEQALSVFRSFPMPAIVKPVIGGSSVGTTVARDFPTLVQALGNAYTVAPKALVEEFIQGREATVGVIDDFRGQSTYPLLPVEIVPHQASPFFDFEAKYSGKSSEICPGNFSEQEKHALMDIAKKVHEGLDLSHYSRSDFIVSKRGIFFLEVNTLPGLTKESLLPKALRAVGSKLSEFLEHIIELARREKAI